jgi:hypothetical protein
MRERKILLPGVSRLARLVARVRDDTTHRLWAELEGLLTPAQRRVLDRLLEVPQGKRVSDLERWRKEPPLGGSGAAIIAALDQVAEIQWLGLASLGAESVMPPRRLGDLARYGMTADAWLIRRHPDDRRLATLLATARHLEAKSVDDALELLDLLMSAELLNKAQREADKDKARKHPRLVLAAMRALPDVLAYRSRLPAPLVPGRLNQGRRGDRPVAAAGVRPPRARGRRGQPACLRLLRAGAVLAGPQAPRHLRRRLHPVAQPAGPAPERRGVDRSSTSSCGRSRRSAGMSCGGGPPGGAAGLGSGGAAGVWEAGADPLGSSDRRAGKNSIPP